MEKQKRKDIEESLQLEMAEWQTRIEDTKKKLEMGTLKAQDAMQPYIDHMERELEDAREHWQKLGRLPESARPDLHTYINISFKFIRHSFEKADELFQYDGKDNQESG